MFLLSSCSTVIDTLVGGGLVLVGVFITQLIALHLFHIARKERRDSLIRQKYETLTTNILDSIHEIQENLNATTIDKIVSVYPAPSASAACGLALIYFHDLYPYVIQYQNALVVFYEFVLRCYRDNPVGSLGTVAARHSDYHTAQDAMLEIRRALEEKIKELAPRYTKA